MLKNDLVERVNSLPWFHQIDLGDGIVTPGRANLQHLKAQADAMFRLANPQGKSILDIGCYDGFYSLEAHKRGAKRVLATDHFIWQDTRCREAFDIAKARVAPQIEVMDIDVDELSPLSVGVFDIVLFSGVLYHLRHPFLAIERVSALATETLVVETHLDAIEADRPMMVFYPARELNDDPSNWWGPNRACVEAMLRDCGFDNITYQQHPIHTSRGIFHAFRE